MKMTRREATLLFLLAVVALVYVSVTYLILPLNQTITDKQAQLATLDGQLTILGGNAGANMDTQIGQTKTKFDELSKPFAQSIDPEQLEYWVGTLLTQNGLTKLSTAYTNMTPAYPDYTKEATPGGAQPTGVTLQNTANAANGIPTPTPTPSPSATPSPSPQPSGTENINEPSSGADQKPGLDCQQLTLTAAGTYDGISKFMDALYASGRALTVESFAVTPDTTGGETLAVTIRFYGVPLLSGSAQAYSFPSPAGQSALMSPAPTPTPAPSASASASPAQP